MRVPSARQPNRPRLRTGVCWFDRDDGLVVRSTKGSLLVPAERRDVAVRLLASLDGKRGIGELLTGHVPLDAFAMIALISALAGLGLVVEGPFGPPPRPQPDTEPWPADAKVEVLGSGLLAGALRRRLTEFGGPAADRDPTLRVFALDRVDLQALEAQDRTAFDTRRPWVPVFPFGDAVVVGPMIRPGVTACFRCFELRWLGISPAIAMERQYLDQVRRGEAATTEPLGSDEAAELSARILPLLAVYARRSGEPGLMRLLPLDDDAVHEGRVQAHPGCEICGGQSVDPESAGVDEPSWDERARDLARVAEDIAPLVDRYVGVATVSSVGPGGQVDASPHCPEVVVARYAVPQPDLIVSDHANFTHGSGETEHAARTIALIEAIERYCGLFRPRPDVVRRFADLDGAALLPTELPLFSPTQYAAPGFRYRPFEPNLLLGWTWGWNVTRRRRVLVPSTAVWYGAEDLLVGETSNGVAAHSCRGPALQNAALELVERDAFMIHWLHGLSPPQFARDLLRGEAAEIADRVEAQGYDVFLADLTTDLDLPVVLALGVHELGRRPALLVGAGASFSGAAALIHALRELYAAAVGTSAEWKLGPCLDPDDVVELEDHRVAFEHPDWLPHAAFLWAGPVSKEPPSASPPTVEFGVRTLIDRLADKGHDVIGVDITTPEVARCGISVVRAIVPGLQPLAFGTRVRLGGRRLYEAPRRMDAMRPASCESELNKVPHCFP
jgi:ribosomal protein S12 methylthiotransferase accessory factor